MACVPTLVNLTSRAKICRTSHYGLCYRKNETWTLFSPSILVQILRIGLTGRPLWLRMRNSNSMPQATSSSLISLISKRISLSHYRTHDRFVNLGLNSRPTFFGCNASNYTTFRRTPPLVVYFPHTGWTAYTNFSTFTLEYSDADVAAYINNGVATAVSPLSSPFPRRQC
jgi:hypothetical protein